MKTTKKKVAKKVVTPNGAITNSKKPLLAKKKPKTSDLRVNAGGNTELFQFLQDSKKKFLEEYKYPTQGLSMIEQIVQGGKEFNNPSYPFTDMSSPMREFPKADPEFKAFADNPSFPFLHGGTSGPMMGTYPKVEPPKEVTIKSLLDELCTETCNLGELIENQRVALYPIIGEDPTPTMEDALSKTNSQFAKELIERIAYIKFLKGIVSSTTTAVQNTLG